MIKVSLKNRSYKTIVSHSTLNTDTPKMALMQLGFNEYGICNTEGNGSQL